MNVPFKCSLDSGIWRILTIGKRFGGQIGKIFFSTSIFCIISPMSFEWRNCDNHQYSLMKLSLRFLSVVWRVFNWTFPNYCYGTSMNLKKEGNKENNPKMQNKIAIIGYEKYSTSALRERWLTSSQCIGRTAQGKQNGFPLGTSYERWKYRQARRPLLKNKKRSRTTITIKIIDN